MQVSLAKRMEPAEWLRTVEVVGLSGSDLGTAATARVRSSQAAISDSAIGGS